jgi:murein L,D-transpeptidase YcbB/YkuD
MFSSARARLSRRATLAGGIAALAATSMLAACGAGADPETGGTSFGAGDVAPPGAQAHTELAKRLDGAPPLVIGGERLNAGLLRRFYARHEFEPVWPAHQAQAHALVGAVLRAGDQGLNPGLFHADLLRRRASLSPLDRELVLSDAFLSYAEALARGAVPIDRRGKDEDLTPKPVNVAAVLDRAIASAHPAAVIEALAPTTPTYLALLQALQRYRAGDGGTPERLRKIVVNLERQRWLPRPLPAERVWVNVANEGLVFYRDDQPLFSTRVVVGEDITINQSPEFRATIKSVFYNPPWVIPRDIVTREILPDIARNPKYLKQNDMIMLANGEAEQLPGPDAGLGLIMFDLPNRFDVYLHDTPDRAIFNLKDRRISHGCIRVQDPWKLAALLLRKPVEVIHQGIDRGLVTGITTQHKLPVPVPVFVVYETAFVGVDGTLQFRPDFYHRDAQIWQQLQRRPMV